MTNVCGGPSMNGERRAIPSAGKRVEFDVTVDKKLVMILDPQCHGPLRSYHLLSFSVASKESGHDDLKMVLSFPTTGLFEGGFSFRASGETARCSLRSTEAM